MADKATTEIAKTAEKAGWDVRPDGNGHLRLTPPGQKLGISIPTTPGDYRSLKNTRAKLKRMGLNVETGEVINIECMASWHTDQEAPGRFCEACRMDYKVETKPTPEMDRKFAEEMLARGRDPQWVMNALTAGAQVEALNGLVDRAEELETEIHHTLRDTVRDVIDALKPGEFVTIAEIKALIPQSTHEQVSAVLRALKASGEVTRSKRGLYGKPRPPRDVLAELPPPPTEPDPEPEPTVAQTEPALTVPTVDQPAPPDPPAPTGISAPPDPTKPWSWDPVKGWVEAVVLRAADAPPMYEFVTTDKKGRLILKDEEGELFCAVPLAPMF